MAKYRIKVESLEGEELDQEYVDGIECNGFVIMADKEKIKQVCIQTMNLIGIAKMIAYSNDMQSAAKLAEIMNHFENSIKKETEDDFMRRVMGSLFED